MGGGRSGSHERVQTSQSHFLCLGGAQHCWIASQISDCRNILRPPPSWRRLRPTPLGEFCAPPVPASSLLDSADVLPSAHHSTAPWKTPWDSEDWRTKGRFHHPAAVLVLFLISPSLGSIPASVCPVCQLDCPGRPACFPFADRPASWMVPNHARWLSKPEDPSPPASLLRTSDGQRGGTLVAKGIISRRHPHTPRRRVSGLHLVWTYV